MKAYILQDHSIYIDESIFSDIAAGDKNAFGELYKASSNAIYAYLLTFVKNHDDAMDLMQDTFLKIRSAAHLYQPYGKPMAWIYTIAKRLALMKLRSNTTHPNEELTADFATEDDESEQAENRMVLAKAMEVLNEQDRQIVMLHAISGMKHREIAEMLGLSLTNTLNRYNRALKKLRKEIEN